MAIPLGTAHSLQSSQSRQYTQISKWSALNKKIQSWQFVVLSWSIATSAVLYAHLGFTIYAIIRYGRGDRIGMQTMWTGDCHHASNINTLVHVGINAINQCSDRLVTRSFPGHFLITATALLHVIVHFELEIVVQKNGCEYCRHLNPCEDSTRTDSWPLPKGKEAWRGIVFAIR